MKIRNKILLVILGVLLSSGIIITVIWYSTSTKLKDTYLMDISESTMRDAYHAFEYLLTDTSYMATMMSLNEKNIVQPVKELNTKKIMENNQWNLKYLENSRIITDFIRSMNGYKYYIVGTTIMVTEECSFSSNHLILNEDEIIGKIKDLDQEKLKFSMVMMEPIHVEGGKSTLSSDYVVPAVRGILDEDREIMGYVVLYFDYGVIDRMFSSNLPEGSCFQVVNENNAIIYSNCGDEPDVMEKLGSGYVHNGFRADNVGWTFNIAIPSEFYVAGIRRTVAASAVAVGIIFVVAGLVAVFFISRMTTEITVLRDRMHQVSKGDLTVRHEIKGRDEIAQMEHTFNHMIVHIQKLMDKVAQEERMKRLSEFAFLQAQINPHFISNVLNNLVWMAKIQHADNMVPLINSLNALLQNVMHQEKDMIPLQTELEYVKNYLTIVEYSGSYDFQVEERIQEGTELLYIPRFILQPIVENAIHHGLPQDLSREGVIKISTRLEEDRLYLVVEDNGPGMTEEEISDIMTGKMKPAQTFSGIGITNVNERIHLFFGEAYGLYYESELGSYTRVVFRLPIVKEEKNVKDQTCISG